MAVIIVQIVVKTEKIVNAQVRKKKRQLKIFGLTIKRIDKLLKVKGDDMLHNRTFAKINDKWQVTYTWAGGQGIGHRDLLWYEWWYLRYLRIRNFITGR